MRASCVLFRTHLNQQQFVTASNFGEHRHVSGWMTLRLTARIYFGREKMIDILRLMTGFGALALAALFGLSTAPAKATDLVKDLPSCARPSDCIVSGAEVDDAALVAARARKGTGPAVGYASDRRLKTELTALGDLPNGLKVYSFKYMWEDRVRVGVVAQDLQDRADTRHAVVALANGLLGVDYAALGLRLATIEQWQKHGMASVKSDYKPERVARRDEPVRLFNQR
jgi:Chaperone of endosialidase